MAKGLQQQQQAHPLIPHSKPSIIFLLCSRWNAFWPSSARSRSVLLHARAHGYGKVDGSPIQPTHIHTTCVSACCLCSLRCVSLWLRPFLLSLSTWRPFKNKLQVRGLSEAAPFLPASLHHHDHTCMLHSMYARRRGQQLLPTKGSHCHTL